MHGMNFTADTVFFKINLVLDISTGTGPFITMETMTSHVTHLRFSYKNFLGQKVIAKR